MHRISILCVALDEAAQLPRWKAAVDRLEIPPGWAVETVLIDGGSRDGTVGAAQRAGIDRIEVRAGGSIPACRNQGAQIATGDVLAYLDADCEPASDWLVKSVRWFAGEAPTLAGWPAVPPDPSTWVQRAWAAHWRGKNTGFRELDGRRVITHQAFRLLTTRNLMLDRAAFDALGGFDERLATGEDTDFVLRAQHLGLRLIADPALRVVHHGEPPGLRAFFRQQLWHANRASYRTIRRLGGGGNAPRFTALYLLSLLLAIAAPVAAWIFRAAWPWLGIIPFFALLLLPALVIARRAGSLRHVPGLAVLYAAYGLARSIDLLGLHPHKPSWKAPRRPSGMSTTEGYGRARKK